MSNLLSDEQMDQLEAWIGTGPKQFNLLYAITRDGCGPAQFHKMCDNRGPTVTVVYNIKGSVFGGYTSLSWQSSNSWKRDDKAFLFQLAFSYNKLCRKFPSSTTQDNVWHGPSHGPLFGRGHDLDLFYNTDVIPVNSVYSLGKARGEMKPSSSFVYDGVTTADINNDTMDVVEVKVYSVIGMYPKVYQLVSQNDTNYYFTFTKKLVSPFEHFSALHSVTILYFTRFHIYLDVLFSHQISVY